MNGKSKEKLTQVRCTFPPVWPVLVVAGIAAGDAGIEEEQWRKQEQKGRWVKNALKLKEPRSRTRKGREEITHGRLRSSSVAACRKPKSRQREVLNNEKERKVRLLGGETEEG